ncbi:hypothetical protein BOX15_Mlig004676g1 [Macrostomum lignano]|uniref:Uncharacterized protein n=2 Tax=Macrostomum lignano TaxID=282301 RepID=A0A267GPX8_9PLAT|nr:hypothetical protein BOX15_Mlig004676g3 [Macrostomum lignano]PAA88085.1 hypothetical protein BOX15_Mlig004676g1 [Macrostomum lignano]
MSVRWLLLLSCLAATLLCGEGCSSSKKKPPKPPPRPDPPAPPVLTGNSAKNPTSMPHPATTVAPKAGAGITNSNDWKDTAAARFNSASTSRVANWLIAVLPLFLLFQLLKHQSALVCQI